MDPAALAQSPFAVTTFIAAPALLTNASSVLALSTTNRMLRTRDAMSELLNKSTNSERLAEDGAQMLAHVQRVEAQAGLLLGALHAIYTALGSFAAATLVTLIGASLAAFQGFLWFDALALLGLALGALGVACLALGSVRLFRATQLSLANIHDEARLIRARCERVITTLNHN